MWTRFTIFPPRSNLFWFTTFVIHRRYSSKKIMVQPILDHRLFWFWIVNRHSMPQRFGLFLSRLILDKKIIELRSPDFLKDWPTDSSIYCHSRFNWLRKRAKPPGALKDNFPGEPVNHDSHNWQVPFLSVVKTNYKRIQITKKYWMICKISFWLNFEWLPKIASLKDSLILI